MACLGALSYPVSSVVEGVKSTFEGGMPRTLYTYSIYCALGAIGSISLLLLGTRSLPVWGFLYLLALALSCTGELFALRGNLAVMLRYHLSAAGVALLAFAALWRRDRGAVSSSWIVPDGERGGPRWGEILFVGAIFTLILLARFHVLNLNPPAWDIETCGHRQIAASWPLMIEQELGLRSQQSAGMSWTVLHHFFTRLDDPLQFDLDQRVLGVAISLLCCWAVYFLMRFLGGPYAAMLGVIIYGFGPLDIHWSRLPSLHHLPVYVGILLMWASFTAFSKRSWSSFGALALLIVITKFVYPSAKLISFGPFLGMCGALLWERREWFGHRKKFSVLVFGLLLFALSQSLIYAASFDKFLLLPPFVSIQPVNGDSSLYETLSVYWRQVVEFFRVVYFGPSVTTHYTVPATTEPMRAIPSLGIVFMTLVFVHLLFMVRKPFALILIGMIIGGLVPALATGLEDRRFSFVLALLPLLAVFEFVWFVDTLIRPRLPGVAKLTKALVLVSTGVCLWAYQTEGFFSRPAARPIQHPFSEALRAHIVPDTLVVNLSPEFGCSIFYGMYDLMRDSGGRIAYTYVFDSPAKDVEGLLSSRVKTNEWYYRDTELAKQVAVVAARQDWSRKLFVLQGNAVRDDVRQQLRTLYPAGKEIVVEGPGIPPLSGVLFETPSDAP